MAWIGVMHFPGFAEALTSWSLRISTAHKAEVFEDSNRVAKVRLTDDQLLRVERVLAEEDFGALEIKHDEIVDDAPSSAISVTSDGATHTVEWNGFSVRDSPEVARFRRVWAVLAEIASPHLRTENGMRI